MRLLLVSVLVYSGAVWPAPVAYVHEMKGALSVKSGNAAARALKTGDTLEEGQTVSSGKDGSATLRFSDGQLVVLQPGTTLGIAAYKYNEKNVASSNILFRLAVGAMRFVTGAIGATNSRNFSIQTPTATIGIRGTDGVAIVGETDTTIVTSTGTVTMGGVEVTAGQFSTQQGSAPASPPRAITFAPAGAQAAAAGLVRVVLPANTPINVAMAALSAAAKEAAKAAEDKAKAKPSPENEKAAKDAKALSDAADKAANEAAAAAAAAAVAGGAKTPDSSNKGTSTSTGGTKTTGETKTGETSSTTQTGSQSSSSTTTTGGGGGGSSASQK